NPEAHRDARPPIRSSVRSSSPPGSCQPIRATPWWPLRRNCRTTIPPTMWPARRPASTAWASDRPRDPREKARRNDGNGNKLFEPESVPKGSGAICFAIHGTPPTVHKRDIRRCCRHSRFFLSEMLLKCLRSRTQNDVAHLELGLPENLASW